MQFDSISAFFAMGGYGFYVWLSFGVSFVSLIAVFGHAYLQKKWLVKRISDELARVERIKLARKNKQQNKEQEETSNES